VLDLDRAYAAADLYGRRPGIGQDAGGPYLGHSALRATGQSSRFAMAVAELDGRPMVIPGSSDRTVWVWDLAIGTPAAAPFTGHTGWARAARSPLSTSCQDSTSKYVRLPQISTASRRVVTKVLQTAGAVCSRRTSPLWGAQRAEMPVNSNPTSRFASVSPCYEPTAE
jgi:hypothetical protein